MKVVAGHSWDLSPGEAVRVQRTLAARVTLTDDAGPVRYISGVDVAAGSRFRPDRPARAAVVTVRWPELTPVEQVVMNVEIRFPYIPGLLSFREIPALLPVLERMRYRPDLLIVDGQGIAHPRRLGLAAHLGVLLDVPAIGCAKSRLIGTLQGDLGDVRGAAMPLQDGGECVGYALRTRTGVRPVYVSPGHRVSRESAVTWVMSLAVRYRLPQPTHLAHQAAAGRHVAPVT